MNGIATVWTFLIMFLMTADVIGRSLFQHPIMGTAELVRISIVGIIFMHMPHTLWVGRHVRSEIILARLRATTRETLQIFMSIVGAAVFAGIVVSSWKPMITAWRILEYEGEGALRVPTYPIRTLIVVGSAFTATIFLYRAIEYLLKVFRAGKRAR